MVGEYFSEHGGGYVILALGYLLMLGGPIGVLVLFIYLLRERSLGPRRGLMFGLAVAIWASLSELFVPYCGLYPNLIGLVVARRMGAEARWQLELILHAVNFILWPAVGWLLFFVLGQARRSTPPAVSPPEGPGA